MYPFIHIFSWQIPSYGLMIFWGLTAAALFVFFVNKKSVPPLIPADDLFNIAALTCVGIIVGSKLLHVLTLAPVIIKNLVDFLNTPSSLLTLLSGGGVFYGGLFGAITAVWLYCHKYKLPWHNAAELFTCAIPLFHAFGRIGCFLGGCCYGREWEHGIIFHNAQAAPNDIPLIPVQLIESSFNILLFLTLLYLRRRLKSPWQIFPIYLASYAVMRFVLEFFRGDMLRGVFLISTSQWISAVILMALLVIYLKRKKCKP